MDGLDKNCGAVVFAPLAVNHKYDPALVAVKSVWFNYLNSLEVVSLHIKIKIFFRPSNSLS